MTDRRTIAHLAHRQEQRYARRPLFHRWRAGRWVPMTWSEASAMGRAVGAGLWQLGCRRGDRVAVLSETRPEWCIIDLATLGFGGVVVGIYPTSTPEQIRYVLGHSGSRVLFVENPDQLARIAAYRAELADLEAVVVIDSAEPADEQVGPSLALAELCQRGRQALAADATLVDRCRDAVQPDDVATLVYTSGTTGPPKGVVLTHQNLYEIAEVTCEAMGLGDDDVSAVFLPLAHSLQRVTVYAGLRAGATGYFAPSLDRLLETWQAAQPTIIPSVPRVFEKVHQRIMAGVAEQPRHRQHLFRAAMAVGRRRSRCRQQRRRVPYHVGLAYRLVDRVVFSRLRARIFGHRLRYLISGGAPISDDLLQFFHAMGVLILEGYGLTETSAPATLNRQDDYRFGTVGKALPGVAVRIADDGEVLLRGPGNFREYYRDPQATAEAFDHRRWFRTGDIGELDADGFLRITDRKKDLIITAGGKNVAPQNLENLLKTDPLISQVMVHGDRRKYLVALITLDQEHLEAWARANGKGHLRWPELVADPAVEALVRDIVADRNQQLARYETIKDLRILAEDFSVDNDLLTPTLKVKRRQVEQRFAELLDGMYRAPATRR